MTIIITTILASVFYVNLSGKDMYGEYIYVLSVYTLLFVIAISGVREIILKAVAQNKEKTYIDATVYSLKYSIIGSFLMLLLGLWFFGSNRSIGINLMCGFIIFPMYSTGQNWMFWLRGKNQLKILTILNAVKLIVQLFILYYCLTIKLFNGWTICLFFLWEGIYNVFLTYYYSTKVSNGLIDDTWKKQSMVLSMMDLSVQVFGKADVIIMGIYHSNAVIAVYSIVMKAAEAFFQMISSIITAIIPEFYKKEKYGLQNFYPYFIVLFIVPILICIFIQYPVKFLYGDEMLGAIPYIKMYSFVIPMYFLTRISNYYLIKMNLNREILVNKIIAITVVFVLYIALIPKYSILGGVIASYFYFIVQFFMNYYSTRNASSLSK